MNIELTQPQVELMKKALSAYQYIINRAINEDKELTQELAEEVMNVTLMIKNINIKLEAQ